VTGSTPKSDGTAKLTADDTFAARVLDSLPNPVFVKDQGHRFVLVNRAFEELVGLKRAALVGTTDHQHFLGREADFFREVDRGVLSTGTPAVIPDEPFTDGLGREHRLRTTKTPLRGADGAVTHVLGVITELDEVRRAEAELQRAQGAAERPDPGSDLHQAMLRKERLAVLGQLAGGLAHQIRNPLAAISTAASILLRRLEKATDPDVLQALTAIREEVWEANRIITDLLDYARIRPPTKQRVKVRTLFDGVVDQLHVHDAIALVRDEEPGLEVVADERQLRDALANLARNALEAMPAGGRLLLTAVRDGSDVVLAVEDTGPGLKRDVVARLFEPLVTSKPLGLGLGLTLARALVENQGGVLRAGTARGQGARFEVRIPFTP
jgi:PAS domain S-box-containing protein